MDRWMDGWMEGGTWINQPTLELIPGGGLVDGEGCFPLLPEDADGDNSLAEDEALDIVEWISKYSRIDELLRVL